LERPWGTLWEIVSQDILKKSKRLKNEKKKIVVSVVESRKVSARRDKKLEPWRSRVERDKNHLDPGNVLATFAVGQILFVKLDGKSFSSLGFDGGLENWC
jgi:hypothetical protein